MHLLHRIADAGQGAWPITWLMDQATDADLAAIIHIIDQRNTDNG